MSDLRTLIAADDEELRPARSHGMALQVALAAAGIALATALCFLLDRHMSVAGLAMVYLVAVAAMAVLLGPWGGGVASLLGVSALNYFFVPPRYSFEVNGAEYWWTLAVLLGVSLGLNALIASLRSGEARARAGEARAAQLHELSETLAACGDHAEAAQQAARWLRSELGHDAGVLVRNESGVLDGFPAASEMPPLHLQAAQWAVEHGRPLGRGCSDWPDLSLWCAPFRRHNATGAVQILLPLDVRPSQDALDHWHALARQVGLSVERERAAAAATQAHARAEAEAIRNTLLASLSHDLRTPLASIVGSASVLRAQHDVMPHSQRLRLLANLENEARDMTLMADNILQMARLAQPQSQLRTQWESIEEILGSAALRMRRRWEGARIHWKVAAGLPPLQVEAGLIAQVIANLVDNALRSSEQHGEVIIQAGRSRVGVFIAVRDQGTGLPEGDPEELFANYRQGAGDGARPGGAGLGLAICKTIVQAHGGQIQARRCSPGSEFRFDLPAASAKGAA